MRWTKAVCGCVCVLLSVTGLGLAQDGGFVPPQPGARILYVDQCRACEGGDGLSPDRPLTSIQAAIDLARFGDRVFVYPGTYQESLDLKGKAITIKGVAGPLGVPILTAPGQSAVQMLSGEDPNTMLQNLIIMDSLIGVSLVDSHPTLHNLTVVECGIGVLGLGRSDPMINSCILWNNALEDLAGVTAFYCCIEKRPEASRLYNMSADPLFVDANSQDYRLKTSHGRYDATFDRWVVDKVTSPCISTGDPALNIGLEPQPNGYRVNMGAFGNTLYASAGPDPSSTVRIAGFGHGYTPTKGNYVLASAEVESHGRGIIRVEFYADGVLVAQDDDPQGNRYEGEWSPEFSEGIIEFELIAVAVDKYGVRSLSEPAAKLISAFGGGHRS